MADQMSLQPLWALQQIHSENYGVEPKALKWSMSTLSTAYVYFANVTLVAQSNSILFASEATQ